MSDLPVVFDSRRTIVLLALAAGASRQSAAAKADVSDRTLRRWVADEPEFAEMVEIAQGKGRAVYEEIVLDAASKDWRAAAWLLEVLYVGRSKTTPPEDLPNPQPMTVVGGGMTSPERQQQILDMLVAALGKEGAERVLQFRADTIARDDSEGRM